MPRNRVVVHAPRMGGGFGGKETQGNTPAALAALAALKTGRAVRIQFDRDIDMRMTGKRHPFRVEVRGGIRLEREAARGGGRARLGRRVVPRPLPAGPGPGPFPPGQRLLYPRRFLFGAGGEDQLRPQTPRSGASAARRGCWSSRRSSTAWREGSDLPPEVVRERNLYRGTGETNTTHYGEEIGDGRIELMWRTALEQSDFSARRAAVSAWNRGHARVKRGLAITPVKFGISFTTAHFNQAGALVLIYQDGTVQVNHGGTEMGQGLHTKILGVAMRELGLNAGQIRVMPTATDKVPEHLGDSRLGGFGPERGGGARSVPDPAGAARPDRSRAPRAQARLGAHRRGGRVCEGGRLRARFAGAGRLCGGLQAGLSRAGEPFGHGLLPDARHPLGLEDGVGPSVPLFCNRGRGRRGRGGRLHRHDAASSGSTSSRTSGSPSIRGSTGARSRAASSRAWAG